jgi:peroxiredoxin Q/BCP
MMPQVGKRLISLTAIVSVLALIFAAGAGCGKKKPSPPKTDVNTVKTGTGAPDALDVALRGSPAQIPVSLKKLIAETKDWSATFEPYWGKIAPDFTLTDINGNVHTLRKYRGKNVVVLFWLTNNPTCKMEAARLKELRSSIADDSLVILSISNEPPAALKEAATTQGINFVVLSGGPELEKPFSSNSADFIVPTTFFIDQKGCFKLAVNGVMTVDDAKAVINAK